MGTLNRTFCQLVTAPSRPGPGLCDKIKARLKLAHAPHSLTSSIDAAAGAC
jgi:hypothetical protein